MFSVSITHHSKIRELSDGNRVMVVPNRLLVMGPTIFELQVMETKLWVIETENSQNVFSVSITHNSKIRELSDGNRVMVVPNGFLAIGSTIFELWVMKTEL